MEIKLPYFNEVPKMHWIAQPFAVLCNLAISLMLTLGIVVMYVVYIVACAAMLVLFIPLVLFSVVYDCFTR